MLVILKSSIPRCISSIKHCLVINAVVGRNIITYYSLTKPLCKYLKKSYSIILVFLKCRSECMLRVFLWITKIARRKKQLQAETVPKSNRIFVKMFFIYMISEDTLQMLIQLIVKANYIFPSNAFYHIS